MYEYQVSMVNAIHMESVTRDMNRWAAQGWRLVAACTIAGGVPAELNTVVVFLEREKK